MNYSALVDFIGHAAAALPTRLLGLQSPEAHLLERRVRQNPQRARHASPLHHVHPDAPPFIRIHAI